MNYTFDYTRPGAMLVSRFCNILVYLYRGCRVTVQKHETTYTVAGKPSKVRWETHDVARDKGTDENVSEWTPVLDGFSMRGGINDACVRIDNILSSVR